jgi:hypothetical protein
MATRKPAAKAAKRVPQYIHETNTHSGEHRIVMINADGVTVCGEWARNNQIATFDALRACTDQYAGLFPIGIFRVAQVPTIVL